MRELVHLGAKANVIVPLMTTLPFTVARPPSTPMRLRRRLTVASTITTSPGCTGAAEADALHAAEENQLILVLGLREDEDRAYLSHSLRQDGWRQRRPSVRRAATGTARSTTRS